MYSDGRRAIGDDEIASLLLDNINVAVWQLIGRTASAQAEHTEQFDRLVRLPSAERTSRLAMDDTKRHKMRRNSVANGGASP